MWSHDCHSLRTPYNDFLYFQHKERVKWNLQYARQDNQEEMMTLHSKLWQKMLNKQQKLKGFGRVKNKHYGYIISYKSNDNKLNNKKTKNVIPQPMITSQVTENEYNYTRCFKKGRKEKCVCFVSYFLKMIKHQQT